MKIITNKPQPVPTYDIVGLTDAQMRLLTQVVGEHGGATIALSAGVPVETGYDIYDNLVIAGFRTK